MNIHERLLKGFPAGFTPKGGPKKISPGELRQVYSQLHGDQLRWNELEMEVELDGQSIGADDLELHYVYQSVLRYWLFIHVPVTYSMYLLLLAHLVVTYAFRGSL